MLREWNRLIWKAKEWGEEKKQLNERRMKSKCPIAKKTWAKRGERKADTVCQSA